LIRGPDGVADVIVLTTLGANLRRDARTARSLRRRRPARAEPDDDAPEPVEITRVTVIRGAQFTDDAAAREWIDGCGGSEVAADEIAEALRLLNRAVQAHRVAAGDPYATDVSRERARRIRLGYGSGDELVDGRWHDAYAVPPPAPRGRGRRMLEPHEQLARILGGRRSTYPSEDLLLRARVDLDQQRTREAALQARAGHGALEAELASDEAAGEARAALQDRGEALRSLATTALERELDDEQAAQLEQILLEMERFARRRRHAVGEER
jgi:hypothetical protein